MGFILPYCCWNGHLIFSLKWSEALRKCMAAKRVVSRMPSYVSEAGINHQRNLSSATQQSGKMIFNFPPAWNRCRDNCWQWAHRNPRKSQSVSLPLLPLSLPFFPVHFFTILFPWLLLWKHLFLLRQYRTYVTTRVFPYLPPSYLSIVKGINTASLEAPLDDDDKTHRLVLCFQSVDIA